MLFLGFILLVGGAICFLIMTDVITLADSTVRARLLDKRTLEEAQNEHKRFKTLEASGVVTKFFQGQTRAKIERKLVLAGYPPLWTLRNIMIAKIALPCIFGMFALNVVLGDGSIFFKVILVGATVVAWFVPDLLIGSRGTERQQKIEEGLPDILDKLHISLKAGLGFDSALLKTLETSTGPAADELIRTTQDIRVGMPRKDAYESLRLRTKSESLNEFIKAIAQAEEKGVSIAKIVAVQSKEMRIKRKLRAEGKAAQVSVKMLGPLFACIFPVLFVIILAPGIFSAIATFKH